MQIEISQLKGKEVVGILVEATSYNALDRKIGKRVKAIKPAATIGHWMVIPKTTHDAYDWLLGELIEAEGMMPRKVITVDEIP